MEESIFTEIDNFSDAGYLFRCMLCTNYMKNITKNVLFSQPIKSITYLELL